MSEPENSPAESKDAESTQAGTADGEGTPSADEAAGDAGEEVSDVSDEVVVEDEEVEVEPAEPEEDSPFAEFFSQLRALDPQLDGLEPAASEAQLEACEMALGRSMPPLFRRFLRLHNGGSMYETTVYGAATEDAFDLALMNLRVREDGHPERLVAFASTLSGDLYCFDMDSADDDGEAPVVLMDVEEGQTFAVCSGFETWLDRLPTLETEIAESRGPQPMSIEEWESFLNRERAKLRRLSKTPAKELTMPDPERVRAELNGKIPVDPRHLKPKE